MDKMCVKHDIFVTDDGVIPTCDICDGPQYVEGDDWNENTGNHFSCEKWYNNSSEFLRYMRS